MQSQVSLFGQAVEQKAEKPWMNVCCEPCWNAKGNECVCRCGGRYHGKGLEKEEVKK